VPQAVLVVPVTQKPPLSQHPAQLAGPQAVFTWLVEAPHANTFKLNTTTRLIRSTASN
jgi:hypothetical protein